MWRREGLKARLFVSLLVILSILACSWVPHIVMAEGSNWLAGWSYRKVHLIIGSIAGAQTNYPIMITVHYGSGSDIGGDVYLEGNCRTDFGDVRFTDSAGPNLDYWMQQETDFLEAVFWVKIPYIPSSPGYATIYIYYGNATASAASNGSNTFTFHDDFETDLSKWTVFGESPKFSTLHPFHGNQGLEIQPGASNIERELSVTTDTAIRVWFYDQVTSSFEKFVLHANESPDVSIGVADDVNHAYYVFRTGSDYHVSSVARTVGWHLFEITNYGSESEFWIDNEFQGSFESTFTVFDIGSHWADNAQFGFFDVAIQRTFCLPEPTNGAWVTGTTTPPVRVLYPSIPIPFVLFTAIVIFAIIPALALFFWFPRMVSKKPKAKRTRQS
jgi:hypothetical protein